VPGEPSGSSRRPLGPGRRACWGLVAGVTNGALVLVAVWLGGFHVSGPPLYAYVAAIALASGFEAALANGDSMGQRPEAWPRRLSLATGLTLLLIWLSGPAFGPLDSRPGWLRWLGVGLMAIGGLLRALAIRRLSTRFNSTNWIDAGATLETHGLYRWLAHPSETGLLLLGLGATLCTGGPAQASLLALLYAFAVMRVQLEEAALGAHFGDAYRRYRRTTFDPLPR
jgi:protein-S-isoprenylcysteine O-methyltransferase Ste14